MCSVIQMVPEEVSLYWQVHIRTLVKVVKMSASGKLIKMEMDYSETVDKRLPEYQEIAQVIIMSFYQFICKVALLCKKQLNALLSSYLCVYTWLTGERNF